MEFKVKFKSHPIPTKTIFVFLAFSIGIGLFFQNCGSGSFYVETKSEGIDFSSLTTLSTNYSFIFDPKVSESVTSDQYGRTEALRSSGSLSSSLHPPFSGTSSRLNLEAAPTTESSVLRFSPAQTLELSRYDLNKTFSSEYTLGIVLSQLQFQTDNNVIRILDLYPPESTEYNGHVFLQLERYLESGVMRHRFSSGVWYSNTQHFIRYFNIPADQIANPYFIMLAVPPQGTGFRMIVNGVEHLGDQHGPTALQGSLPPMPSNVRSLQINGYSKGTFLLQSLFLALRNLSQNELLQTYGGIAAREGISLAEGSIGSGGGGSGGGAITFSDLTSSGSRAVFSNSCTSCHSGASPQGGFNLQNYDQAVSRVGTIISRMEGSGGIMPPSGRLPQSQIDLVKQWQAAGTPR